VVWLHDLLIRYGSLTMLWDVHVLVDDPQKAATYLETAGYNRTAPSPEFEHFPEFSQRGVRLDRAGSETGFVLLPAADWHYQLPQLKSEHVPPLHALLNSLLAVWLNISNEDYVERLDFALFVANLINYCYYLKDNEGHSTKSNEFANHLDLEHRELHYDIVSQDPKSKENFSSTRRHAYHVQKYLEIKEGHFKPQPYAQTGKPPCSLALINEQSE
jgi:hypothetical protein